MRPNIESIRIRLQEKLQIPRWSREEIYDESLSDYIRDVKDLLSYLEELEGERK